MTSPTEPFKFSDVTSAKLPRSAAYLYNNLEQYADVSHNVSHYAVITGFEVYIIKQTHANKPSDSSNKELSVELKKVPHDSLEPITCVKWCTFNGSVSFVMGTQNGMIHVYDFGVKKILYSHDITSTATSSSIATKSKLNSFLNPTINCIESDDRSSIFVGLSTGTMLSFTVDQSGFSNQRVVFETDSKEAINCMAKPIGNQSNAMMGLSTGTMLSFTVDQSGFSNQRVVFETDSKEAINCMAKPIGNQSNAMYVGCDDGSVLRYDFLSGDVNVLIEECNVDSLDDEQKSAESDGNICGACVCIAACDEFVVAGYSAGAIKIVQKAGVSFVSKQIAMHRRMVTGLAVLQSDGLIATVSEDGYFIVIQNGKGDANMELVRAGCFENGILMGVEFVKSQSSPEPQQRMLVISAYDRNKVAFV
eukprot:CAMPEP_0197072498 /NCGR_PEP_ID=MMETSP1384-20130603/210129_1 /TAXON_ID=29189 /ORGANISM="Ammonia sp." /LENGTH=419 /DNA_ID=CAMNT_0042511317 /DNA_START=36 /DNA_END=1296 /DNA_ORIENTATION=+